MANYTPNYRLHQWLPEDKFLRTDFNEDFAAIDAALGRTARQGADTAYNLYQLILQRYYEGKREGSPRALLFDGFWDEALVEQRTEGLYWSGQALRLFTADQPDIEELSNTHGSLELAGSVSSQMFTMEGAGKLANVRLNTLNLDEVDSSRTKEVIFKVIQNDTEVYQTTFTAVGGGGGYTITPETPIPVAAGDRVQIKLLGSNCAWLRFVRNRAANNYIAVNIDFLSGSVREGQFTSRPFPYEGAYAGAAVYLRHVGEAVPTLNGAALALVESRTVTGPEGTPCTESRWSAPAGTGPVIFQGALRIPEGETGACLYDYGILLE